jgi:Cu+-exporting ATPase
MPNANAETRAEVTYLLGVRNMTCAACSARVERLARKVPGVMAARVDLAADRLQIRAALDEEPPLEALEATLEKAGYALVRAADVEALRVQEKAAALAESDAMNRDVRRALWLAGPVVVLSMGMMLFPEGMAWHHLGWVGWPLWLLATAVQFGPGMRFYRGAWHALRTFDADMNVLVALGSSVAWVWSTVALALPHLHLDLWIEASAAVIAMVLVGKSMELRARSHAQHAVDALLALRPHTATRLHPVNLRAQEVALNQVQVGDLLLVRVGERFPADGVVVQGETQVDESLLTGESQPVDRRTGQVVTGGSRNVGAAVHVRVTHVGDGSTLARMATLVAQAQESRMPVQALVDRVVRIFVPVVVTVALATLAWHLQRGAGSGTALLHAVSVLVVACPCAMGLATPLSLLVATRRAAQRGVLLRNAAALQDVTRVRTILFDKTGTLTDGELQVVTTWLGPDIEPAPWWTALALAESTSEHPVGRAIVRAARAQGIEVEPLACGSQVWTGRGISLDHQGRLIRVGQAEWLRDEGVQGVPERDAVHAPVGATRVDMAWDDHWVGALYLQDQLRVDAVQTLNWFHEHTRVHVGIVSGDSPHAVETVARALGIADHRARQTPEDKLFRVQEARLARRGAVIFVGDGLNDAPVLAGADVGVAMGSGVSVSMEACDAVLPGDRLAALVALWDLAHRTRANIRWNLFWAFGYNTALIPLAAGALTPWFPEAVLTPMWAAGAMGLSSLFVVTNALQLGRRRARVDSLKRSV